MNRVNTRLQLMVLVSSFFASSCLVQENVEKRPGSTPHSTDALGTTGPSEFIFDLTTREDFEETFILENTQQEQILVMRAVYKPMNVTFKQIERPIHNFETSSDAEFMGTAVLDGSFRVLLAHTPIIDSLVIESEEGPVLDFVIVDGELDFSESEGVEIGSFLNITYRFAKQEIILPHQHAADSLLIFVDDNLILPSLYEVNNQTVNLSFVPPAESVIRARYLEQIPLLNFQILGSNVQSDSVIVSYNGVTVPGSYFSFDPVTGGLSFLEIPGDGVEVAVAYQVREKEQLSYDLARMPSSNYAIRVLDFESRQPIDILDANGQTIEFYPFDFVEGRRVAVIFKAEDNIAQVLRLTHEPMSGSFRSNFERESCLSGNGLSREGRTLRLECELDDRVELRLNYTYQIRRTRFTVPGISNPDQGLWEVYFDETKTASWTRDGSTIVVPDNLPTNTRVKIRYLASLPPKP